MAALRLIIIGAAMLGAVPAHADPLARWRPIITEASTRFDVPVPWIERVIRAESGGHTMLNGRRITSRAGAMGLMQLMPATWAEMRARLGLGADPHHPRDNILAGTAYLRLLHDRFGYPGLFGAYNAGPARYAEHLRRGRRLPGETVAYLARVTETMPAKPAPARQAGLFIALSNAGPAPAVSPFAAPASGLFVPLATRREPSR